LHQLATIDLEKEDYEAARENLEKAMKIRQQIGDRIGEAATFYQLGIIAWRQGKALEALRLITLGHLIFTGIGHSYANKSFENLLAIASQLSLSQEQFDALQKEVAEAYRKDRGQSLIDAAFPKVDPDASSHQ
jgi:tetratricopeptide (TPR) repeat protein